MQLMKTACRLSAEALVAVGKAIKPGATTYDVNRAAADFIFKHGGVPTFKGYDGFPGDICISLNDEVIHGIPSRKRKLREGDIVSVDLGATIGGFVGDNAFTFPVGGVSALKPETAKLLKVCRESLYIGISKARKGARTGEIGNAVQTFVEANGLFIVRKYVGHGVGRDLHEEPQIPNYGPKTNGERLARNMTIAIEPMVNERTATLRKLADGWTEVEAKGGKSAHFEHSVAVTEGEPLILTESEIWLEAAENYRDIPLIYP
jgi:methionyl aminopeptidase